MRSATSELLPWAMFANGPQCIRHGWPSSVWIRFGLSASLSSTAIAPAAPRSSAVIGGAAVEGVRDGDGAEAPAQVLQVARDGHDRHHLGGRGDVEAALARVAVGAAAERDGDLAQGAVVHVHRAPPADAQGVDVQRVAVQDRGVEHRREQVVGRADRVDVAGEVQVEVLHRHDLGHAAAGGAALDAEHRARATARAGTPPGACRSRRGPASGRPASSSCPRRPWSASCRSRTRACRRARRAGGRATPRSIFAL